MTAVAPIALPVNWPGYYADVPLRGPDFGKWSDVPQFREMIGSGAVTNFGIRLKAFGVHGPFKGIHVAVRLQPASCKDGVIVVSAGSDPEYDCVVRIGALRSGDFDKGKLTLAVLSLLDFSKIAPCDIHIGITSPIGVGASLGTSAAMSVGILRAFLGAGYPASEIAAMALHAESDIAGRNTGNQDQIASAYGSDIRPSACQTITVRDLFDFEARPIAVGTGIRGIFDNTLAAYIGSHDSSDIHRAIIAELSGRKAEAKDKIEAIRATAGEAELAIQHDDGQAHKVACDRLLEAQKALSSSLVNPIASKMVETATCPGHIAGFAGACIPGAGGRGGTVIIHLNSKQAKDKFAESFRSDQDFTDCRLYEVRLADEPILRLD